MAFIMKSAFIRKITFPLQLKHLKYSMKGGDIDWYNEVDEVVILGAIPLCKNSKWIADLNLGGVVSLTQSYENKKSLSVEAWAELGITNVKYDVADHVGAASPQQVAEIIQFIEEQGKLGKQVYVHCKAGKGRSASVVVCYLCKKHNIPPQEAEKMLREKRKQIDLGATQWKLVNEFHKLYVEK